MNRYSSIIVSPHQHIFFSEVAYDQSANLLHAIQKNNLNTQELEKIRSDRRKAEWLMIRKMLLDLSPNTDIYYNEFGKPFLKNSKKHISISHSHHMVAIAIDEKANVGVDLQHISNKVIRIREKFLNPAELERSSSDAVELTCYWSLKEALFKIYGKDDAFLKDNFEITELDFNGKEGSATGIIDVNEEVSEHQLKLHFVDDYILAYTVNS